MDFEQEEVLSNLRQIDEYDFEEFIAKLWNLYGWETEVTSGSNDRGIDVIAEKHSPFEQKHLIQVKRWGSKNKVGGPEIQQYSSLLRRGDGIDAVVVVTTSSFSRQAKELAGELNVKLVDGFDLYEVLSEVGADNLLKQYTGLGHVCTDSKDDVNSDSKNSNTYLEQDVLSVISNETKEAVRNHRSVVSNHKYNMDKSLSLSFLDGDNEVVSLSLHYSSIFHNAADFSIRTERNIPKQILDKIRDAEGVDQAWIKDQFQIGVSSAQGNSFPECRVISIIIKNFRPKFSEENELYIDETVPDSDIPSTDESNDSGHNISNSPQTDLDSSNRRDGFDIEKEFDDSRWSK